MPRLEGRYYADIVEIAEYNNIGVLNEKLKETNWELIGREKLDDDVVTPNGQDVLRRSKVIYVVGRRDPTRTPQRSSFASKPKDAKGHELSNCRDCSKQIYWSKVKWPGMTEEKNRPFEPNTDPTEANLHWKVCKKTPA